MQHARKMISSYTTLKGVMNQAKMAKKCHGKFFSFFFVNNTWTSLKTRIGTGGPLLMRILCPGQFALKVNGSVDVL